MFYQLGKSLASQEFEEQYRFIKRKEKEREGGNLGMMNKEKELCWECISAQLTRTHTNTAHALIYMLTQLKQTFETFYPKLTLVLTKSTKTFE